jgi:hypothetical protein
MTRSASPCQKRDVSRPLVNGSASRSTAGPNAARSADDDHAPEAHRPHHVEARQRQRAEADRHRRARDERCHTRGGDRRRDRVLHVGAPSQFLAEAIDDQQRVVDAEPDAEDRAHVQGEDRHLVLPGHEPDQPDRDADRREPGQHGKQTGNDATEYEQQQE